MDEIKKLAVKAASRVQAAPGQVRLTPSDWTTADDWTTLKTLCNLIVEWQLHPANKDAQALLANVMMDKSSYLATVTTITNAVQKEMPIFLGLCKETADEEENAAREAKPGAGETKFKDHDLIDLLARLGASEGWIEMFMIKSDDSKGTAVMLKKCADLVSQNVKLNNKIRLVDVKKTKPGSNEYVWTVDLLN